ncbi:chromate transporter [Tothia fuscella]|uniref:Chromate transporter n=1 Tax=Tothia fuscella TaxID=1048955 RepID=A0A9P4NV00_9PEZI|nr:chromate transporter [Tothia fuscella]
MPLLDLYRAVRDASRDERTALKANQSSLGVRLFDVFLRTWDLGFTAFGGPPVHFQTFHQRFVEGRHNKAPWIDEQTYQELFAICQALPGPGSTKMLFCIILIHAGFIPAIFVFLIWSLPAAICMYALSLGVQRINDVLPAPVYPLLSGLNAATVGIIALAAVQLAEKAITNKLTRILVIFGACAGLCYTALWYFPVLIIVGGIATVIWDQWVGQRCANIRANWGKKKSNKEALVEESNAVDVSAMGGDTRSVEPEQHQDQSNSITSSENHVASGGKAANLDPLKRSTTESFEKVASAQAPKMSADVLTHAISVKVGIAVIILFFVSFIAIIVARGVITDKPRELDLFANMYLAGTIIFGGGPVVIPLLREYVVEPGWVSTRDFLLGLAIIQAFPGPNFNFAVFLGALALQGTENPTVLGALLGYIGIFTPGITLAVGVQSLWSKLRHRAWIVSLLRGINATAVGLVFTAVYRLWEMGYLTRDSATGQSLAKNPWWVVVTALTYAASAWFHVPPAVAIAMGAILGLCWYGAVGR